MMKEKLKQHIYSNSSDVKKDESITEFIKIIVSDHYGFGVSDLMIKTRKRKNVMCRHVCMYAYISQTRKTSDRPHIDLNRPQIDLR